jgi:uncharacterized membrane protein YvbJ
MKACPSCGAENHDQAVSCKRCDRPFPGYESQVLIAPRSPSPPVRITDIDMPFGSMVAFMVKWAIASIPAFVILFVLGLLVAAVFGGLLSI